jgi:hypothetical protein
MPALFPPGSHTLALIRTLATRGDKVAEALMAIMNGTYWVSMSAGDQAEETRKVTGQLKDQDGSNVTGVHPIVLRARASAGEATITVDDGTAMNGDGSDDVWLNTETDGSFSFDLELTDGSEGGQEGTVLVEAVTDNGEAELVAISFEDLSGGD